MGTRQKSTIVTSSRVNSMATCVKAQSIALAKCSNHSLGRQERVQRGEKIQKLVLPTTLIECKQIMSKLESKENRFLFRNKSTLVSLIHYCLELWRKEFLKGKCS